MKLIRPVVALAALSVIAFASSCAASTAEPESTRTAVDTRAPSPSPTPVPTPDPTPDEGSREAPFESGVVAKYADDSMWQLSVSDTDPDAWPEVQAASEWNEPPAEGESFVSTVLTITTESDASPEGVDPGVSLSTEYVTANGRSYDARMCSINNAPPPGVIYEIGAMYPEATADAYLCAAVPTEDVKGGTWRIGYIAGEQSVFFTGAR